MIVMLVTLLYVLLSRKSVLRDWTSATPQGKAPSSSNPIQFGNDGDRVIQSISDEEHLKKAVGLVVCGWTISFNDGDREDETESTGTCFSISSSGHLVTNKHVVESAEKRQRMAKAFVLKDYAFALVMPKARTLVRSEIEKGTINPPPRDDEQFEKMSRAVAEKQLIEPLMPKLQALVKEIVPKVWVFLGSRDDLYVAKVIHISESHDMAVLKIENPGMPYLRLESEADKLPHPPNHVFALGFPGTSRVAASQEERSLDNVKERTNDQVEVSRSRLHLRCHRGGRQ